MKKLIGILLLLSVIASAQEPQPLTQDRAFADAWIDHEQLKIANETIVYLRSENVRLTKENTDLKKQIAESPH